MCYFRYSIEPETPAKTPLKKLAGESPGSSLKYWHGAGVYWKQ